MKQSTVRNCLRNQHFIAPLSTSFEEFNWQSCQNHAVIANVIKGIFITVTIRSLTHWLMSFWNYAYHWDLTFTWKDKFQSESHRGMFVIWEAWSRDKSKRKAWEIGSEYISWNDSTISIQQVFMPILCFWRNFSINDFIKLSQLMFWCIISF